MLGEDAVDQLLRRPSLQMPGPGPSRCGWRGRLPRAVALSVSHFIPLLRISVAIL